MTLAFRKLALLEKRFSEQEEFARINGYSTCPVDKEFKEKVEYLMKKVRRF